MEAATGKPITFPWSVDPPPTSRYRDSPDRVAFLSDRLWDLATGRLIGHVFDESVGRGGGHGRIVLIKDGQQFYPWDVSPVRGSVEAINLWLQVLSRMELTAAGEGQKLDEATWQARRERLKDLTRTSACSDFVAAAARDPLYWLRIEAEEAAWEGQEEEAIKLLDRLIAAEPTWTHYDLRSRAYGQQTRFGEAMRDCQEARRRGGDEWTDEMNHWLWYAELCLQVGDRGGYRDACAKLLGQFGRSRDVTIVEQIGWMCVHVPDAVADWPLVVQWVERAVPGRLVHGAALYRAGQYEQALARLTEVPKKDGASKSLPEYHLFLAMVHFRLGQVEEAKKRLQQAHEGPNRQGQWMKYQLLAEEAKALMDGTAQPKQ